LGHALTGNKQDPSTRERLLDVAAALFWERGYAATTTREIAQRLGIRQASLYYHVATKEELLYQLGVSSLEQLRADVQEAVAKESKPLDRIGAFIHAHLETLLKHQVRHVTALTELHGLSEAHRAEVLGLRKKYASYVQSILEDAQRAGAVRADIPARYLYLALLNLLNWAVFWFRRDRTSSVEHLAEAFGVIFLEGAATPAARVPRLTLSLPEDRRKSRAGVKSVPGKAVAKTPERMLERAAALFSSKGYAATSTREIAAGLGMKKASLYYHIETKEDLLHAICESCLQQIRADVEAALSDAQQPVERVRAMIAAHVESLLRDQDRHSATLQEMHLISPERRKKLTALQDAYEDRVRAVLGEAQEAGVLRGDIPVEYLCLGLLGLMNRVVIWYRPSGTLSPSQLAQLMADVFLTGVVVRRQKTTERPVKSSKR